MRVRQFASKLLQMASIVLITGIVAYISECALYSSHNVVYLPDPSTVPLAHLNELDVLDQQKLEAGKNEMAKHKVIIAGIIRNNAIDSPVMIKHIEHIGSMFKDYKIVLFENDSDDGTQIILNHWALSNDKVHVISKKYGNQKRHGVQFLADARNHYINAIKSDKRYKGFDILMVVDMDMKYGLDIRGIEDSFSKMDRWDGVCSNGIFTTKGEMFDMFAFRETTGSWRPDGNPDAYLHGKVPVPGVQGIYRAGDELIQVHSCFGGLAFYKMSAVKDCMYDGGDCEHVPFHACINKNGGKIFLNPSQMLLYSHYGLYEINKAD